MLGTSSCPIKLLSSETPVRPAPRCQRKLEQKGVPVGSGRAAPKVEYLTSLSKLTPLCGSGPSCHLSDRRTMLNRVEQHGPRRLDE